LFYITENTAPFIRTNIPYALEFSNGYVLCLEVASFTSIADVEVCY